MHDDLEAVIFVSEAAEDAGDGEETPLDSHAGHARRRLSPGVESAGAKAVSTTAAGFLSGQQHNGEVRR